jgi:hypothetical protein
METRTIYVFSVGANLISGVLRGVFPQAYADSTRFASKGSATCDLRRGLQSTSKKAGLVRVSPGCHCANGGDTVVTVVVPNGGDKLATMCV